MSIWQLKTDSSRCSNIHTKFKSMTLRHFNFLCYSTPMSNPWDESKGLKLHLCFVLTLRRMKMILELCLVVALLSVTYARSFPMFSFIYVRQWMADLELGGGGGGKVFLSLALPAFLPSANVIFFFLSVFCMVGVAWEMNGTPEHMGKILK